MGMDLYGSRGPIHKGTGMKFFCYGTLKSGGHFHHYLKGCPFVGNAKIRGTMFSLGDFPAVVLVGTTDIHGEVYEIDGDVLEKLDRLEGYPGFYDRQVMHTSLGDAVVYFHQWDGSMDNCPVVRNGNWPVGTGAEHEQQYCHEV